MDKIQKIKQEIERRIDLYSIAEKDDSTFSRMGELSSLIDFIDSLPEEHNEDLEEEIEIYINDNFSEGCDGGMLSDAEPNLGGVTYCDLANLARYFAEWQKQQMMKDVMETTIVNDWQYGKDPDHAIIPAIHQRIGGFTVGDKVKIIILKTE